MTPPGLHPQRLRTVFGAFPTGVTTIAATINGQPIGLTASSFTSVSLDPPIVSVCVAHTSSTWPLLRTAPRLGISVLGAHQENACRQLASRVADRFAGVGWHARDDGGVFLDGSSAWLDCVIEREITAGDHTIVLLRVCGLDANHDTPPLVFHASRYRRLEAALPAAA